MSVNESFRFQAQFPEPSASEFDSALGPRRSLEKLASLLPAGEKKHSLRPGGKGLQEVMRLHLARAWNGRQLQAGMGASKDLLLPVAEQ
jgi:hypothetical protein